MDENRKASFDVAVVGAGVGGLCAAARLAVAGRRVLLLERAPEVGGRASSFEKDGYTINTGAVAIEHGGAMQATFEEVGAPLELRYPSPANVFRVKGRTIDPSRGGWAVLMNAMTKRGAKVLTQLSSARHGEYPEDQLTLEEWLAKATSNQTVHRLFRNLAAAIFAVNADEIPARSFLTYFMEKGAFRKFGFHPEGTVGVCRALARAVEANGGEVWRESEAVGVTVAGGAVRGLDVRRGGETAAVDCGAMVSNIGPSETIDLIGADTLGVDYVDSIRRQARPTANIIIHVAGDEPLLDAPGLVVFSETERICNGGNLTATCPELAPDGKHLTVFYAVPRPAIGRFDADREVELSLAELREHIDGMTAAEVLDVRVMQGSWPAQRAASGHEMPRDTPLANLWNVGDGVRDYGSGGTQSCAETARDVVAEILATVVPG